MSELHDPLRKRLAYRFADDALLLTALTHRSAGGGHNERLEFLGDSILNFVIAEAIYKRFPQATEGELSRLRASLVKKDTLAEVAGELRLGEHLRLGSGELKSGGYRRASILADAVEAVLGAVYLDGGFEAAHALILRLFQERLVKLSPVKVLKDPKTRLQEHLQSRHMPLPNYEVTHVSGQDHDQTFRVLCQVEGLEETTEGEGNSRRKAEQDAASKALEIWFHE